MRQYFWLSRWLFYLSERLIQTKNHVVHPCIQVKNKYKSYRYVFMHRFDVNCVAMCSYGTRMLYELF
jgi:hypothetical protein